MGLVAGSSRMHTAAPAQATLGNQSWDLQLGHVPASGPAPRHHPGVAPLAWEETHVPFPSAMGSALRICSTQECGLGEKNLHEEAVSQNKVYLFISRPQMRHCKAGPGGAYYCGLHAWPWHSAAPRKASFLQLEAGEDAGKISVQADKPHRPGTRPQGSPSCSVSGAPCSWLAVTSPAGDRDSVSACVGTGGLRPRGSVASPPPRDQAAYLEQGDRGAVEEAQEEEHDEGGGHGVEVLKAFLLGAHLPLCGR